MAVLTLSARVSAHREDNWTFESQLSFQLTFLPNFRYCKHTVIQVNKAEGQSEHFSFQFLRRVAGKPIVATRQQKIADAAALCLFVG